MHNPSKKIDAAEEKSIQEKLTPMVEKAVLDCLRQKPLFDFSTDHIQIYSSEYQLPRWLSLPKDHPYQNHSLSAAINRGSKTYQTFSTELKHQSYYSWGRGKFEVNIKLKDGFEWVDAAKEAWKLSPEPNPYFLSINSLKILGKLKTGKLYNKPIGWYAFGQRCHLRGSYSDISAHLVEIRLKTDIHLHFKVQRDKDNKDWITVWTEDEDEKQYGIGPLNPPLRLDVEEATHEELERFRSWLYEMIRKGYLGTDDETIGVFDIHDRKTLQQCFRGWQSIHNRYNFSKFFDSVRLIDGIELCHEFENDGTPWLVVCQLQAGWNWSGVRDRLNGMLCEVPLEKKYGLSPEASSLLRWIQQLRPEELLSGMTPPVQENLKSDIGLKINWSEDNLATFLELLVEEINEKTEYELRTHWWKNYNGIQTRILIKKKRLELENLIRLVQLYGLGKNRVLDSDSVQKYIEALFKT